MQNEDLPAQNQTPSLQINVRFEKDAPETPIIEPSIQSVRALANWYRENGIKPQHIPISGARIGNTEIPPLYSQEQDFDEEAFRAWAEWILGGPSAVTMDKNAQPGANWNNIELDILRKVYGNMARIEAVRHLKEEKDIKKWVIHNINKMRLDEKLKEILDERLWQPLEFKEDIDLLNTRIKDVKEYGPLSEEAIDYMFGCIMQAHILGKGKKITIKNNQPIVETGNPAEDSQWKWIFETIHFGEKDGQSKIADYVAAHAYHNINKDLVSYYGDLSQKIVGTSPDIAINAERIEKSNLSPSEKSFMSLWLNNDVRLWDIQARQRDYVERARENIKGKSPETLKRDFHRDALWTLAKVSPLIGAGAFVAIFGILLATIWGKESKLAKVVFTVAAGLWVVGAGWAVPTMLSSLQKNALDNGNAITQAPRRTQNTGDFLTDAANKMPEFFRDKWNSVSAFFSNSNDWSTLMLDERIGPKLVDKYPTGAILAVLNPDPDNEFNEKWKWTPTQEAEIEEILKKLDGDERAKLNTMLQETWDKYKNANKNTLTNAQLKNGTIKDMIDSLDTDYGWFNKSIRPAYWFDEESKEETLVEFAKHPNEWKDTKIGDIMVTWFGSGTDALPDVRALWNRVINQNIPTLISSIDPDRIPSVKKNIQKIWEANAPCDPEKTLGELLTKEV